MEDLPRLLVSHPSPDGSVVICAVGPASVVRAEFVDEAGWRDITALVPDLLLIGLAEARRSADADDPSGDPSEEQAEDLVRVGRVYVTGEDPELLFASPAGQVVQPVTFDEARPFIESAIAAQITAGVAAEAVEADAVEADAVEAAVPSGDRPAARDDSGSGSRGAL